ncbi:MAG: hypothetical protein ACYSUN_05165 [Planctomycetota bacterium]|jgi:hypothetical protein
MGVIRMRYFALAALLCVLLVGCPTVDEIFLSPQEVQDLADNLEASMEVQEEMSEFVLMVTRGDVDPADYGAYTYDAPSASNGWVGTLSYPDGSFPFGDGALDLTFTVVGDAGPANPLLTDLTDDTQVDIDAVVSFAGQTPAGAALITSADFTMMAQRGGLDELTTVVNGDFDLSHDGYVTALDAHDLEMDIDLLLQEVTAVSGNVDGRVDIPGFAFDADFDVTGLGDSLRIGIRATGSTLNYFLAIDDLY